MFSNGNIPKWLAIVLVLLGPLTQGALLVPRLVNWIPVWGWYADPGYVYLLNGAVIVRGGTPGHIDHPGTSLQWIIGIVEQVTYWLAGNQPDIFSDVVNRPEMYAQVSSWSLFLLYISGLTYLSLRMLKVFGLATSMVSQIALLWMMSLLSAGIFKLVAESGILIAAIFLLALLVPLMREPLSRLSTNQLLAIGVVSGIGLTSKVTFLPLLLLPLILVRPRDLWKAILSFFITVTVVLIPTIPRLEQMWIWYSGLIASPGRHGRESDSTTITNLTLALDNISGTTRWWILIYLMLLVSGIAVVLYLKMNEMPFRQALPLLALTVTSFAVILLGSKESEPRDFILIAPIVSMLIGLNFYSWSRILNRKFVPVFFGVAIIGLTFLGAHGVVGNVYNQRLALEHIDQVESSAREMMKLTENGILIQSYDSWTESGALAFAEFWSNGEFSDSLYARYQSIYIYSIFDRNIYVWNSQARGLKLICKELKDLSEKQVIQIVVPSASNAEFDEITQSIKYEGGTIFVDQPQKLGDYTNFKVDNVQCN